MLYHLKPILTDIYVYTYGVDCIGVGHPPLSRTSPGCQTFRMFLMDRSGFFYNSRSVFKRLETRKCVVFDVFNVNCFLILMLI